MGTKVKPYVKYINYNHMMPTRYTVPAELGAQSLVTDQQMNNADGRVEAKKFIKKLFQEKFVNPPSDKSGKPSKDVLYLRKKLRFWGTWCEQMVRFGSLCTLPCCG